MSGKQAKRAKKMIRALHSAGFSVEDLADSHGLSDAKICKILGWTEDQADIQVQGGIGRFRVYIGPPPRQEIHPVSFLRWVRRPSQGTAARALSHAQAAALATKSLRTMIADPGFPTSARAGS